MVKIKKPNFKLKKVPNIEIRSLHIKNFKAYDDYHFDFTDGKSIKSFICFIGENGTGKSTILEALQLVFSRLDGREADRIREMLGKSVRHVDYNQNGIYGEDNFLIEADIKSDIGDYAVSIDKNGFINDHPEEIKLILYRLCYFARFDQELHQFQLVRKKWKQFKSLFESVTGYEIEEMEDVFSSSDDPRQAKMLEQYVLGFTVKKPYETIHHKECSKGERKVIKSFSTMLNLEIQPKIILIDDIAMHVALGKHISLIDSMQKCYPKSQIFSTTHSYRMTKCLKRSSQIYDLRLMHASEIIASEPWRLRVIDEIKDAMYKLEGLDGKEAFDLYNEGLKLLVVCYNAIKNLEQFRVLITNFLKEVSDLYVIEMLSFDK